MGKLIAITFIPVRHDDSGHQLILAVLFECVPDHNLFLRELAFKVQGVIPVKLCPFARHLLW